MQVPVYAVMWNAQSVQSLLLPSTKEAIASVHHGGPDRLAPPAFG